MKPDEFFVSFVEGNLEDLNARPNEIRLAFNAAVSASHFADHYFTFNKLHNPSLVSSFESIGPFVEYLSSKTGGAFGDIRSISNAYKHLYTDKSTGVSAHSTINSAGSIETIHFHSHESLSGMEAHEKIIFTRKDGTRADFLSILEATIIFLGTLL